MLEPLSGKIRQAGGRLRAQAAWWRYFYRTGMRATPVYRPEPYPVRRIQCQSFFRAEILGIRAPGAALEAIEKFRLNFRLNAFFPRDSVRNAADMGLANYTPILLSQIPAMSCRRLDRADIAPRLGHHRPTANGYVARNWRGHSQGDGGSPILFGDMFIFKAIAIYLRGSGSLRFKGALENSRLHLNRLPILQDHLRQRSSYSRSQAAVFSSASIRYFSASRGVSFSKNIKDSGNQGGNGPEHEDVHEIEFPVRKRDDEYPAIKGERNEPD